MLRVCLLLGQGGEQPNGKSKVLLRNVEEAAGSPDDLKTDAFRLIGRAGRHDGRDDGLMLAPDRADQRRVAAACDSDP